MRKNGLMLCGIPIETSVYAPRRLPRRLLYSSSTVLAMIALMAINATSTRAQTLGIETVVSGGLSQPLFLTAPAGDPNRLFILEKGGQIRIFDRPSNTLLASPYLSIPVMSDSEAGLLGLAFDPHFATNGLFYVNYVTAGTGGDRGDIVVARLSGKRRSLNFEFGECGG